MRGGGGMRGQCINAHRSRKEMHERSRGDRTGVARVGRVG